MIWGTLKHRPLKMEKKMMKEGFITWRVGAYVTILLCASYGDVHGYIDSRNPTNGETIERQPSLPRPLATAAPGTICESYMPITRSESLQYRLWRLGPLEG